MERYKGTKVLKRSKCLQNFLVCLVLFLIGGFVLHGPKADGFGKEPVGQTLKEVDTDEDGRKETILYSSNGAITFSKSDKDGDGRYEAETQYKYGKKHIIEFDYNGDGKPETWVYFDVNEKVRRRARDKNLDGKPDHWYYQLETREQERGQIREYDKNFDGKVDKREMTLFQFRKAIGTQDHVWQWKEEDKDFDGLIDVYRIRGEKNPKPNKVGTKMNEHFTDIEDSIVDTKATLTEKSIKQVEERERMIRRSQESLKYE